jgi:hypothetical protein
MANRQEGEVPMKNDYSYGWQKLYCSVQVLVGPGDLRERLADALLGLGLLTVSPEDHLPEVIRAEFTTFLKKMVSVKAIANEGNLVATVNSLDETDLRRAAEKILDFYDKVCRYQEPFKS